MRCCLALLFRRISRSIPSAVTGDCGSCDLELELELELDRAGRTCVDDDDDDVAAAAGARCGGGGAGGGGGCTDAAAAAAVYAASTAMAAWSCPVSTFPLCRSAAAGGIANAGIGLPTLSCTSDTNAAAAFTCAGEVSCAFRRLAACTAGGTKVQSAPDSQPNCLRIVPVLAPCVSSCSCDEPNSIL